MQDTESQGTPDQSFSPAILSFLFSRSAEDASGWLTTVGMFLHDYPELQLYPLAGNHCRAAKFLMGLTARKLALSAAEPQDDGSMLLRLCRADLREDDEIGLTKLPEIDGEEQTVIVRLELQPTPAWNREEQDGGEEEQIVWEDEEDGGEQFEAQYEEGEVKLLSILPPKDRQESMDDWLRWACRSLGQDTPHALPFGAAEEQMEAAFERARQAAPELRRRFLDGLAEGQYLVVKFPLPTRQGGVEYVWGVVLDWPELSMLHVRLDSEPRDCKGYKSGQRVELLLNEVSDFVLGGAQTGIVFPGFTQRLVEEFGLEMI